MTSPPHTIDSRQIVRRREPLTQSVQEEIRIAQSVQAQTSMPTLIAGNLTVIAMILSVDWNSAWNSGAIYVMGIQALLLVPLLRSYLRLRDRPRPEKVSERRIRTIELFSLLMGMVWACTSIIMMSYVSHANGVLLFSIVFVLAFGGVLLMPSLPVAALGFSLPIALAMTGSAIFFKIAPFAVLLFLCGGAVVTLVRFGWDNWKQTVSNTRLRVESVEAEAKRARTMEVVSSQLGKYMSPQLYQSIFSGDQKVEIASKRKKLTIFFSDIAGFTEITDQLESEELTALLNRYLTEMSKIAQDHGGTIDKFIGDAIVVYFGDPETLGVKEDADQCVRMAIAMQSRVRELQQEWLDMGLERTFELRIGINTGYCTVGNFGSEDRMDYTIVGSEVNLAARLESVADVGGILLANETHSLVDDWVRVDEGVPITVKGFPRPVQTFRVKGVRSGHRRKEAMIQYDSGGLLLEIDLTRMGKANRVDAERVLNNALDQLQSSQSD